MCMALGGADRREAEWSHLGLSLRCLQTKWWPHLLASRTDTSGDHRRGLGCTQKVKSSESVDGFEAMSPPGSERGGRRE